MNAENSPDLPAARAIKDRAADWLERADRGDWGADDDAKLEQWLSESPAHRMAYWRVKSAWDRAQRLHVLRAPGADAAKEERASRIRPIVARAAAALVLLAAAGTGALLFKSGPRETAYSTGVGGREVVALTDGSKIELNTNTSLRVRLSKHERSIILEKGEAFFQVKHDASRPFTVLAGNRRVTDIGTKFFVRRYERRFEVALVEGRAQLDAPDGTIAHPVMLSPGDVVKEKGASFVIQRKPETALANELGWRRGVIVFTHATLAEAAAEFNRYNAAKIRIADPKTARLTIGGTFEADNVDAFARLVRNLLGVKVERRGEDTVISQ
jgi:transmembrane sensor